MGNPVYTPPVGSHGGEQSLQDRMGHTGSEHGLNQTSARTESTANVVYQSRSLSEATRLKKVQPTVGGESVVVGAVDEFLSSEVEVIDLEQQIVV